MSWKQRTPETQYIKCMSERERIDILLYAREYASPSVQIVLHLMDKLGIRVSEAVAIKEGNIDFENSVIWVYSPKQKLYLKRRMPLHLKNLLKKYVKEHREEFKEDYIAPTGYRSKNPHIQTSTIQWFFTKFRKHIKHDTPYYIRKDGNKFFRISAHTFRSRWITKFYENSAHNLRLTQMAIGHKNSKTTLKYVRYADSEEKVTEVLDKMF